MWVPRNSRHQDLPALNTSAVSPALPIPASSCLQAGLKGRSCRACGPHPKTYPKQRNICWMLVCRWSYTPSPTLRHARWPGRSGRGGSTRKPLPVVLGPWANSSTTFPDSSPRFPSSKLSPLALPRLPYITDGIFQHPATTLLRRRILALQAFSSHIARRVDRCARPPHQSFLPHSPCIHRDCRSVEFQPNVSYTLSASQLLDDTQQIHPSIWPSGSMERMTRQSELMTGQRQPNTRAVLAGAATSANRVSLLPPHHPPPPDRLIVPC